ncbi:MAG: M48 family metallopeptidase [Phycisphaerales bacterium]|nr:M48 family metallopeptidase [Phycisphaerales bacterium]MCI0675122.1 M48 family metallopeptidase [Phycisphaerales bacterium]
MRHILTSLTLAGSLGLSGCATNPSTGRSQLILVSPEQVAAMGEQAKPELIREMGGEVKSQELRQYIASVGRRLARHVEPEFKDIQWEFITLDSDVINAFALPGGKVFISRGLLQEFNNEAQVATVLGHEIGHVTARHVDERVSQSMVAQLGMEFLGQASNSDLVNAGAQLLTQGTILKFSRDQESEADRQGLKYMTKAGYDPSAALDVMRVLIESGGGGGMEILSTHPDPRGRLEDIQRLLDTEYRYAVNNPQYKKFAERFQQRAQPHLGG